MSGAATPAGEELLLYAERALTPSGELAPLWLRIRGEQILETGTSLNGPGSPGRSPDITFHEGVVSPGFIDMHCHGGGGASFEEGLSGARAVLASHSSHGTTTQLASLVSADLEHQLALATELEPLIAAGELAGVHLEGPWISPAQHGAHDRHALADPSATALSQLLTHPAARLIHSVTLAPELSGAQAAITALRGAGVVVGLGHTAASYEQTREALAAGATVGTHVFNAMRGIGHRDPGPIPALLEDPSVFLELIADGVHLHPAMLRLAWNAAASPSAQPDRPGQPGRIVLVSDAMAAAVAQDGEYDLGTLRVRVADGVARVISTGAIAGSTLTLSAAVRYCIQRAGITPQQALAAATAAPAAMAGFTDRGVLQAGHRADLVVLDSDWQVDAVMRAGAWLKAAREWNLDRPG